MSNKTKIALRESISHRMQGLWERAGRAARRLCHSFTSAAIFWSALCILLILWVISAVVLSVRLHEFARIDDRSVSLRASMTDSLDVFAMEYKNAAGVITVSGQDGEKVIAPGVDAEYTLRLRNTDRVALDYSFRPQLSYTTEHTLPILIRLLDPQDRYVIGDASTWVPLDEIGRSECKGTLRRDETAEYVLQWKWPFESGDDGYDSFLGSATADGGIGLHCSFVVSAEANMTVTDNGGLLHSPVGRVLLPLMLLLFLAAAIVLLLIHVALGRATPGQAASPITDAPVCQTEELPVRRLEVGGTPTTVPTAGRPSFFRKMAYVNIDTLQQHFQSGDRITIGLLKGKGLIPRSARQMKLLARSAATLDKAFIVETQGISRQAETAIYRAGGCVILTAPDTGETAP